MEVLSIPVPGMWADHHVLAIRKLLSKIPGVGDVRASALERTVAITYDAAQTDPAALDAALADKGYTDTFETSDESGPDKPEWSRTSSRATATNAADLTMSGDYRKY
jgi:copper chaperone CopZ